MEKGKKQGKGDKETTPKVVKGVEPTDAVNPNAGQFLQSKKRISKTAEDYVKGIVAHDRVLLSQAITLVESNHPKHQAIARSIVELCLPHAGKSIRIGVTGTPGVGKSTFIESFGTQIIKDNHRLAVLAIDPSSPVSKGSIMGDKTRMEELSTNAQAFIRPSPAGTSLGGVAQKTRETIILCEAAGFDTILVETVGVGQSETAVHSMVDFFLLLLLPGAGDELQGIKRGIVEMADLIAINKADQNVTMAKHSKRAYNNALHLFPPKESQWTPKAVTCSGLSGDNLDEIWAIILDYQNTTTNNQFFQKHRTQQSLYWLHEGIKARLERSFYDNETTKAKLKAVEAAILKGDLSSFGGVEQLFG